MDVKDVLLMCKTCGKPVRQSRFVGHPCMAEKKKGHVAKVIVELRQVKAREQTPKKQKSRDDVLCPVCSMPLAWTTVDSHLGNVHSMRRTEYGLKKVSKAWNGQLSRGAESPRTYEDVYDRGLVYSGGGFGVGRSNRY